MPHSNLIKQMTSSLLVLRRMQDKTQADFIASLGNLSLPQLTVLNIIGDFEHCTMGDIAKHALLSLSSVTLIVNKLTKAKLVIRTRNKADRRIVQAKLSAEGLHIYHIQINHLQGVAERMMSALSVEEQQALLRALHKLTVLPG